MRAGTLDRDVLEANIRHLRAQGHSSIPHSGPYLGALRQMKSPLLQPTKLAVFIDEIKAKIGVLWHKYADLFQEIGEPAEFLRKPDLYGEEGDSGKLHDFKNNLSLLIDLLHSRGVQPVVLDELSGFQVYINQVFNRVAEDKKTDIVADAGNACRNFNVFREGRLHFSSDVDTCEVPIDIIQNSVLIVEMLQNALSHSSGGQIEVKVEESGRIVVKNQTTETLNFHVDRNQIVGEIESGSASGSGQGIRMLVETAKKSGILFSLTQGGQTVTAVLDYSGLLDGEGQKAEGGQATVELTREAVEIQPLGNVVFICHDGTSQRTFGHLQAQPVEGFAYVNTEFHSNGWTGIFEEYAEQLENACLCVVHVTGNQMVSVIRDLKALYPHLIVVPVSYSEAFKTTLSMLKSVEEPGDTSLDFWNVLGRREINEFADSPEIASDLHYYLYRMDLPANVWEALIKVAHKMAMERKKAQTG